MLTFTQFLAEKLYDAADTRHGYCEIFVNPTDGEMREVGMLQDTDYYDPHPDWGPSYYLGALVDDKRVFIFDRDNQQHADAIQAYKQKNPSYNPRLLTLYFHYYPKVKKLGISTSGFSSPVPPPPIGQVMTRLKGMPWFNKFKLFEY